MTVSANAIEVLDMTRRFGPVAAVDHVSFNVGEGEIFGFLGPNGAGKTTLIRMLTTLIRPSSGTARISGFDVVSRPDAVRRSIGVVPQAMTSDLDLTGHENMDIYGRFYSIAAKTRKERICYLLDKVGLSDRAGNLVGTYSGGMRRRLEIARGLLHQPKILFLDEPSIGLDPQSRRVVWEFIRNLSREETITIFLSTHYMEEAEALCSRIAIIDSGKIIAMGTPDELKSVVPGNDIITLAVENLTDTVAENIRQLPFVHKIGIDDGKVIIYVDSGARNLPLLIDEIRSMGRKVISISLQEQSLEDVFIHFTGKSIRKEESRKVNFLIGAGIPRKPGR